MRLIPYVYRILAAVIITVAGARAWGQTTVAAVNNFDGLMRGYNAVVLGNATLSGGSDSWGAVAVGGDLTMNSWVVAQQPSLYPAMTDPSLYVNGNLILTGSAQLQSGYASTPNATGAWTFNSSNQRIFQGGTGGGTLTSQNSPETTYSYQDPRTNPTPVNWNWATIQSTATSLSAELAAAAATGTIAVVGQTLTFSSTSTAAGVVVFNLNALDLGGNTYQSATFSNFQFNVATDQTYVINVLNASGRTLFGAGTNMNASGVASQLLWNITGSGNVTATNGSEFFGSVLAPSVTLSNGASAINGQVLAGGLTYSGAELHYTAFSPTSVLVPEPATYAVWTVALCGAGLWWHRRRRTAQA